MKTESEVKQEITKDIHISLLKDALTDLRAVNEILKKALTYILCILALSIVGLIALTAYHNNKLFHFMENVEFNSEVNMVNDESNANNMYVDRK